MPKRTRKTTQYQIKLLEKIVEAYGYKAIAIYNYNDEARTLTTFDNLIPNAIEEILDALNYKRYDDKDIQGSTDTGSNRDNV